MGASADALLLFVPVASDAPASSVAGASTRSPRLARSKTREATMEILTIIELMRLTRIELFDLVREIINTLPNLPEGSVKRRNALINLCNIRKVLAWRRDLSP
jgi:hypothetical protein